MILLKLKNSNNEKMKIMKHIISFLGSLLAVALIGATFTACAEDDKGSANVGLGIKVFFPTKVVTNQPMTINGSGFDAVTEIEFPGGTKVSNFELVGNDMIKVNAPSGIPAEGGKIIVRTADDQAESRLPLTIGHTKVTGFSKQPGETASGGEQITVYGSDLEFINSVELLDANGEPQLIDHKDFYRKGTNNLIFTVPVKNIYKGTFVGTLHTYDGLSIPMPELAYEPAPDDGHWEIVKTSIWKNDGSLGEISWGGDYPTCLPRVVTGFRCASPPVGGVPLGQAMTSQQVTSESSTMVMARTTLRLISMAILYSACLMNSICCLQVVAIHHWNSTSKRKSGLTVAVMLK